MGMILVGRRLTADQVRDLEKDPATAAELVHGGEAGPQLDLDKAWHGIHFLLTGSGWETTPGAGGAVLGGEPLGEDAGYGPARLLRPGDVAAIAAGLRDLDTASLRARFDPAALSEQAVYPDIWDEEDVFDTYLAPHFDLLKAFYLAAADENEAVLLAIT